MRFLFQCGHAPVSTQAIPSGLPSCPRCGSRRVARVLGVPVPRIVGHGSGPLVESKLLEAIPVPLATVPLTAPRAARIEED